MKNKQHEYIFKAFLSSKIPAAVHEHAPNLIAVDSAIGGYCTQLLRHEKNSIVRQTALYPKRSETLLLN